MAYIGCIGSAAVAMGGRTCDKTSPWPGPRLTGDALFDWHVALLIVVGRAHIVSARSRPTCYASVYKICREYIFNDDSTLCVWTFESCDYHLKGILNTSVDELASSVEYCRYRRHTQHDLA